MRRWLLVLLWAGLLFLLPSPARAAGPIVSLTYPATSPTDGTVVFQKIPWHPGDKIQGSVEVALSQKVRNLVVQTAGGALSLDETSRRVIPRHRIQFFRSDVPQGSTGSSEGGGPAVLSPANTYMFDFIADGIPGEDTYRAPLEATGEYLDASGQWIPFQEMLPALKLKAFDEARIELPNKQLTEQWTNMNAPFGALSFLERFLDLGSYSFFYHDNPQAIVSITMPGNPHVKSSVEHSLTVTMDAVMDEDEVVTPWVHFWQIGREETRIQGIDAPSTQKFDQLAPNEIVQIGIYREHEVVNGRIESTRIPPGIYRSTLHIRTDWGSEFVYPVEIRVRDHPFWSVLALVLGIGISLLANYWQNRQPLYQAQLKAKQFQRIYLDYGVQLSLIERVIQRLNSLLAARDVGAVNRVNGLLADLVQRLPETMVVESLIHELEGTAAVHWTQVWARVLEAPSLAVVLAELQQYCAAHVEPAVRELGPRFETLQWNGVVHPLPPISRTDWKTWGKQQWGRWYAKLFGAGIANTVRLHAPEMWDRLTVLILFVMVNAGLIALQITESYGPNRTFGSAADYLNLLFWGFAGDATRNKLTALAGNFRNLGELRRTETGASAGGKGAEPTSPGTPPSSGDPVAAHPAVAAAPAVLASGATETKGF